jgi:16S rRNA (guanine1207-N2)-methyltransferase
LSSLDFSTLRRWPDIEAENLYAYDASDRLLLDLAAAQIPDARVVIIGDNYGALTTGALELGARGVRVYQDELLGERALDANTPDGDYSHHPLGPALLNGATLVLMQLPRSLGELEEQLDAIARYSDPGVTLFAAGRIKHITPTMNPIMQRYFGSFDVSHAQQKSRAFTLRLPRSGPESPFPVREFHTDLELWNAAHGAVFAGATIDFGTRMLLLAIRASSKESGTAIDLGCGSGLVAASIARSKPGMRVIATDQSAAAVASARLTAELNGVSDRVTVIRDDGLEAQPDNSAELVALNPPFHIGAAVHAGQALRLFADAARVLRPGGELWTVFNTHLGYRQALARIVGPTDLITHNAKFTVTVSRKSR